MRTLWAALRLDFTIQVRYHLVTVSLLVTGTYCGLLYLINQEYLDMALIYVLFSDPVVIGIIFIGALVLFEKDQLTLDSLMVTPLSSRSYLWSKAISLTLLSLLCCYILAFVAKGSVANHFYFATGVILTSVMFVFMGFLLVADARSLNQYILRVPVVMVPLALPLLNFLGITDTFWFYPIPTQATLILFSMGVDQGAGFGAWDLIYSYLILVIVTALMFWQSLRAFDHNFHK